jgi:amino-acid N-acetyltransferase
MFSVTNSVQLEVAPAQPDDLAAILRLVESSGLPTADIGRHINFLVVARKDAALIGCVGLETHGEDVLLRSLAVDPAWRGHGLGTALVATACRQAQRNNAKRIVLLTTDAARFFTAMNFTTLDRSGLSGPIIASRQFSDICPSTATVMVRTIDRGARSEDHQGGVGAIEHRKQVSNRRNVVNQATVEVLGRPSN